MPRRCSSCCSSMSFTTWLNAASSSCRDLLAARAAARLLLRLLVELLVRPP